MKPDKKNKLKPLGQWFHEAPKSYKLKLDVSAPGPYVVSWYFYLAAAAQLGIACRRQAAEAAVKRDSARTRSRFAEAGKTPLGGGSQDRPH